MAAGVEPADVYVDILGPAMHGIGDGWQRGELGIDQEHLATGVALSIVGRMGSRFQRRGRRLGTVLVAMPTGERHMLGASMLSDILAQSGYEVLNLGADTPPASLAQGRGRARRPARGRRHRRRQHPPDSRREAHRRARRIDGRPPVIAGGFAVPDAATARSIGADEWGADPRDLGRLIATLGDRRPRTGRWATYPARMTADPRRPSPTRPPGTRRSTSRPSCGSPTSRSRRASGSTRPPGTTTRAARATSTRCGPASRRGTRSGSGRGSSSTSAPSTRPRRSSGGPPRSRSASPLRRCTAWPTRTARRRRRAPRRRPVCSTCVSTAASQTIEDVAEAAPGGRRWFQLYVQRNRSVSRELVRRAEAAGYEAICLTVDLPVLGYRDEVIRRAFDPGEDAYANLPKREAWRQTADMDDNLDMRGVGLTWDVLDEIRSWSSLPLVLKGILTGEDAALAVEHGVDGVWVSNHGGRQLDRTAASIEVLDEVVRAVDGRAEVYLDGGVRRGPEVLIALALGATAVFTARPFLYALACAGEAGVAKAFEILRDEIERSMALLGTARIRDIGRRHVEPGEPPRDRPRDRRRRRRLRHRRPGNRAAAPRAPAGPADQAAGQGAGPGPAPDRSQQWRAPCGPVLRAGVIQGAPVPCRQDRDGGVRRRSTTSRSSTSASWSSRWARTSCHGCGRSSSGGSPTRWRASRRSAPNACARSSRMSPASARCGRRGPAIIDFVRRERADGR